jgi:predicted N-acyltransferase
MTDQERRLRAAISLLIGTWGGDEWLADNLEWLEAGAMGNRRLLRLASELGESAHPVARTVVREAVALWSQRDMAGHG